MGIHSFENQGRRERGWTPMGITNHGANQGEQQGGHPLGHQLGHQGLC